MHHHRHALLPRRPRNASSSQAIILWWSGRAECCEEWANSTTSILHCTRWHKKCSAALLLSRYLWYEPFSTQEPDGWWAHNTQDEEDEDDLLTTFFLHLIIPPLVANSSERQQVRLTFCWRTMIYSSIIGPITTAFGLPF